jgi:hypothetical protein
MGSISNYNWTTDSDVDVHVIIDYSKLQMPPETAIKAVKTAGAQWNLEHEVTVKGFKVEMNLQNFAEQKPYVTGIYSIVKDQWIRKPFKMPIRIDRNVLRFQYEAMKKYVQTALDSGDREQMKSAKKYLDAFRQYGLDTYGELSYENIIFKILRARGIIKKLKDSITAVYDKAMTVNEVIGMDIDQYIPPPKVSDVTKMDTIDIARMKMSERYKRNVAYAEGNEAEAKIHESRWQELQWELIKRIAGPDVVTKFSVNEVGEKDVKQTLPNLTVADNPEIGDPKFDRSYWDKMDREKDEFRLPRLTMDELKSLREKALRMIQGYTERGKPQWAAFLEKEYAKYDAELKRRIRRINAPIVESPLMTKKGATALAGDKPLKSQNVEEVYGNIVVIRQGKSGGFVAVGWTLVYFMDSDESAQAMKQGKIPYLIVPRATFMSGGSPITDIWLKKFQKPGTEHILGVIEGHSDEKSIFIDMITVRPGWKRNHIAKLMMDRLKKTFPESNLTTSTQTDSGQKLFKSYGGEQQKTNEGFGSGIPEKDRLKIKNTDGSTRRWQVRSKNAPKTPKMTDTPPKAIEKFDEPQHGDCLMEGFLLESALRGEWWFEDGQALFADGDVGDTNHEGMVIDRLKREIIDELGGDASDSEYVEDFDAYAEDIFEHIGSDFTPEEIEDWKEEDYFSVIKSYILRVGSYELKEKFLYAYSSNKDAREYALIHWGWQRVKGNVIQTQTLTSRDIKNISNGLYEAYGEQLEDPEVTFEIEVMATRSYYTEVPWPVIQKDDPTALNAYRARY